MVLILNRIKAFNLKFKIRNHKLLALLSIIFLMGLCVVGSALGAESANNMESTIKQLATPIKIALLLGLIPVIPSVLVCLTCFTRVIIVFSLLRNAIGTRTTPPNQVIVGLTLFMTFFIMQAPFKEVYNNAIAPYIAQTIGTEEAFNNGIQPIRRFMLAQVREKDLALFIHFSGADKPKNVSEVPTTTIIPAFIISELRTAFQIGFLLYLPFLVIDTVLASVLLSMGMFMLPPMMISLPIKLLLFVLVDGWNLIVGSLIMSFR